MSRKKNNTFVPEANLSHGRNKGDFIYRQVSKILRDEIASGNLKSGDRLPSLDLITLSYNINKATARRAVMELIDEGLLYTIPAKGTYVTDLATRSESSAVMLTIGVVSRVMVPGNTGYFHLELLESIRHELMQLNANMVVLPVSHITDDNTLMQVISGSHMNALIYIGPFENITLTRLETLKLPSVILDHTASGIPIDAVTSDNRNGGYLAIKHLLNLGHRNIAVIAGTQWQPATTERLRGAEDAALDAEITLNNIIYSNFTLSGGYEATAELLNNELLPTAIFYHNDEMAAGGAKAIRDLTNLHIPDDISIIGFDDVSLAEAVHPRLSTIHTPVQQMSKHAIYMLKQRMEDNSHVIGSTALATKLIVRESTASPKR